MTREVKIGPVLLLIMKLSIKQGLTGPSISFISLYMKNTDGVQLSSISHEKKIMVKIQMLVGMKKFLNLIVDMQQIKYIYLTMSLNNAKRRRKNPKQSIPRNLGNERGC